MGCVSVRHQKGGWAEVGMAGPPKLNYKKGAGPRSAWPGPQTQLPNRHAPTAAPLTGGPARDGVEVLGVHGALANDGGDQVADHAPHSH